MSRFSALLLPLLLLASTLLSASVNFQPPQTITTNFQHLTGLAVADFNGDGKPDIAVTDDYTQTLVVYLNDGTGHFSPTPHTTTLHVSTIVGLGALVAGDVNEDGKQDLIVAPVAGLQYDIVLLGNGDGTFTQGETIAGSYGFRTAALVDINSDGHLDLISEGDGSSFYATGDGAGHFSQTSGSAAENTGIGAGLAYGDFFGMHHIDFVVADYLGNDLHAFGGNGDDTFRTPVTINVPGVFYPDSLATADFNGDGKLDLAIGSADIALLVFGNGDGTFQTASSQGVLLPLPNDFATSSSSNNPTPPTLATADMDANGTPDIVAADPTSNKLSVLLNDGTGRFPQQQPDFVAELAGFSTVRLADVNGDGLPDIIVGNGATQNVFVYLSIRPKATPTLTLQSSTPSALVGSTITVTAQLAAPANTTGTPTGTITLASGSTSFGQQTVSSTGSATFTLSSLSVGQYPLAATYSGDSAFLSVASPALTQSITDFQAALASSSQTVQPGASATYTLNLSALSGFTGPITISCSGLPTGYICSAPAISLSSQTAAVSVTVNPPSTVASLPANAGSAASDLYHGALVSSLCLLLLLKRRRYTKAPALLLDVLVLGIVSGCSGGTSSSSHTTPYTGTSSFVITATAMHGSQILTHQVTATLIVQ